MRIYLYGFLFLLLSLKAEARPAYCQFLPKLKSKKLLVAVIDTGIDIHHRDLAPVIWSNKNEIPGNQVDDDGNGYIDDTHGWNFAANSADLEDSIGHGTHVAGLVAGDSKKQDLFNSFEIMTLKYYDRGLSAKQTATAFFKAFEYALLMKADVIQISGGGYAFDKKEQELFKRAEHNGVLVVAANGNKKAGAKDRPFFPAAYGLKNIFSVVATDRSRAPLGTSNLFRSPHLFFTVGKNLNSTLPKNSYGEKTGSSQAAGLFTGKLLQERTRLCPELVANSK